MVFVFISRQEFLYPLLVKFHRSNVFGWVEIPELCRFTTGPQLGPEFWICSPVNTLSNHGAGFGYLVGCCQEIVWVG